MMMHRTPTFEEDSYHARGDKTEKQVLFEQMDAILPWEELLEKMQPYYYKGKRGRPPFPLEVMLRVTFAQQWLNRSDRKMKDTLKENLTVRFFARLEPDQSPDASTICKFRGWLQKHNLGAVLLELSKNHLEAKGILTKMSTSVDSTIIDAPTSTKNEDQQRDPEMKSTRKGKQWHFGMKAHIGTDANGYVHSAKVTAANVHDSTVMEECLHGEEEAIYGDKGYVSEERKQKFEARGVRWRVLRKASRGKQLTEEDKAFNRECNRMRSVVEDTFGVVKHLWGHRKVRYRGLRKNAWHMYMLFGLANFYRARKQLAV